MSFSLPGPYTAQAPLCTSPVHLIVYIVAFNRYVMDVGLMSGACSVMYDNTIFQFLSVKFSLLDILARFNQIL